MSLFATLNASMGRYSTTDDLATPKALIGNQTNKGKNTDYLSVDSEPLGQNIKPDLHVLSFDSVIRASRLMGDD